MNGEDVGFRLGEPIYRKTFTPPECSDRKGARSNPTSTSTQSDALKILPGFGSRQVQLRNTAKIPHGWRRPRYASASHGFSEFF